MLEDVAQGLLQDGLALFLFMVARPVSVLVGLLGTRTL
jgi:hypothetical protein